VTIEHATFLFSMVLLVAWCVWALWTGIAELVRRHRRRAWWRPRKGGDCIDMSVIKRWK